MSVRIHSALALGLSACSGAKQPAAMPDAAADAQIDSPVAQGNIVTLKTDGTPMFIAFRDGAGPWQTPAMSAPGYYALPITYDFEWVVVCMGGQGFRAGYGGATFDDGALQIEPCVTGGGTPPTTVSPSGFMKQAGRVQMFDTATSATPNWSFVLHVPPGMHDVVADDGASIYVQRDRAIGGASALGVIDLAASGTPMSSVALTVNNLGGDTLGTWLQWHLAHDYATFNGTSTSLLVPPASLVLPGDDQLLVVSAQGMTSYRDAYTSFTGSETTFDLPPVLDATFATTGGSLSATWTALPACDTVEMYASAGNGFQHVRATSRWLTLHASTGLSFDLSAPGYDPAWQVDLTGTYYRGLDVTKTTGNIGYQSAIF